MTRKELNHSIRALAHGRKLKLDEDTYRDIVNSITGKEHITDCDDEEANLVLLHLRQLADNNRHGESRQRRESGNNQNDKQHRMIPRLMDYLKWNWSNTAEFCLKTTGHKTTHNCNAAELSKIIRGMIATIDHHLVKGKIVMTPAQRSEYERHVRSQRNSDTQAQPHTAKFPSSIQREGSGAGAIQLDDLPF